MKPVSMLKSLAISSLSLLLAPAVLAQTAPTRGKAAIDAVLDKNIAALETLYKDLHEHPELGFQEQRTAKLLAAKMRALGFGVTEKVGTTGVVAVYRIRDAGPFQAAPPGTAIRARRSPRSAALCGRACCRFRRRQRGARSPGPGWHIDGRR